MNNIKLSKHYEHLFSLIELLVVVSIISILTAILLPALNKAKLSAYRISCLNNTKTIMSGMAMYADNYKYFPPRYDSSRIGSTHWFLVIAQTLSGKDASDIGTDIYKYAPYYRCPSYRYKKNPNYNTIPYGKNDNLGSILPSNVTPVSPERVKLPSQKIAIGDSLDSGRYQCIISGVGGASNAQGSNSFMLGRRHDGKASVAFVDGHAEHVNSNRYSPITILGSMDYETGAPLTATEALIQSNVHAAPLFLRQAWGFRGSNYDNMTGDGSIY